MIVEPQLLSDVFFARHHFHVINAKTGETLGLFASLYCAAQTVLDGRCKTAFVRDVVSGETWPMLQLIGIRWDNDRDFVSFMNDPIKPPLFNQRSGEVSERASVN